MHNPVGALTANITLPFLNAHKKALAAKEAETGYQQSLASYRQTLYRALGETQNAILNLQQSRDEAASLQTRLAQAKDIENLTRIRYQAGKTCWKKKTRPAASKNRCLPTAISSSRAA